MFMFGKSDIRYRELGMKARDININWTTSLLDAQGVRDTSDTTGKKMRGLPELVDGPRCTTDRRFSMTSGPRGEDRPGKNGDGQIPVLRR